MTNKANMLVFHLILSITAVKCQISALDTERGVSLVATNPLAGKD